MAKKLYVGNLPYSIGNDQLSELFGKYGTIESVQIITDQMKGNRSKGFGFVEFADEESAMKALEMNGQLIEGRTLVVSEAKPMKPRESFGGSDGGYRNNNRGGNDFSGGNRGYGSNSY